MPGRRDAVESEVRRETYGEDLGQSSWLTASEWLGFADQLGIAAETTVLEVGSGSGGPAAYVCRGFTCQAPVTTPAAVRETLRRA